MHQTVRVIEEDPSLAIWSSGFFGLRRFHPLPCGFMRFHHTTMNRFWSLLGGNLRLCKHLRDAIRWSFTRHGWCHKSFQFSSRIFDGFFVFFVIRIDIVNRSQSPSIVELGFFFCPFLFFFFLSGFTNLRPNIWPYMIWSGSRLNLCPSLPGPHISLWRLLFQ